MRRRLLLYRLQSDKDNVINWTPVKYQRGQLVGGGWRKGGGGGLGRCDSYELAKGNYLSETLKESKLGVAEAFFEHKKTLF